MALLNLRAKGNFGVGIPRGNLREFWLYLVISLFNASRFSLTRTIERPTCTCRYRCLICCMRGGIPRYLITNVPTFHDSRHTEQMYNRFSGGRAKPTKPLLVIAWFGLRIILNLSKYTFRKTLFLAGTTRV
jgi:hypothetical protein